MMDQKMLFQVLKPDTGTLSAGGDERISSPGRFRQREGRVPPEGPTRLHLRGLCWERGIGSLACKSLLAALRHRRHKKRRCPIHMKGAAALLCKRVWD